MGSASRFRARASMGIPSENTEAAIAGGRANAGTRPAGGVGSGPARPFLPLDLSQVAGESKPGSGSAKGSNAEAAAAFQPASARAALSRPALAQAQTGGRNTSCPSERRERLAVEHVQNAFSSLAHPPTQDLGLENGRRRTESATPDPATTAP